MNNFKQVKEDYKEKFKEAPKSLTYSQTIWTSITTIFYCGDKIFQFKLYTGFVPQLLPSYPKGFGSYTECMTRALFTGLSSFALSFSTLYFTQVLLKSHLPYPPKHFLIAPAIVSTAIAWTVTSRRTQVCQDTWINSEQHYTEYGNK